MSEHPQNYSSITHLPTAINVWIIYGSSCCCFSLMSEQWLLAADSPPSVCLFVRLSDDLLYFSVIFRRFSRTGALSITPRRLVPPRKCIDVESGDILNMNSLLCGSTTSCELPESSSGRCVVSSACRHRGLEGDLCTGLRLGTGGLVLRSGPSPAWASVVICWWRLCISVQY